MTTTIRYMNELDLIFQEMEEKRLFGEQAIPHQRHTYMTALKKNKRVQRMFRTIEATPQEQETMLRDAAFRKFPDSPNSPST